MQGRALIKFFTILALLVVSFQFLLWIPTNNVESDAEAFANAGAAGIENLGKQQAKKDSLRFAYLDSVSNEHVFSIPGVKKYTYQELKKQQIAYGLDLQGGMSVVLQVNLTDLIVALSEESNDPNFEKALENAKIAQRNAQTNFVTLFGQEYNKLTKEPLAPLFTINEQLKDKVTINSTNAEVIEAIRLVADETVKSTFNLLKQRIDAFGVAQPIVSLDPSTDRITVELPGVRNPKRARNYLQATANLEFWELYENTDLIQLLDKLNTRLKDKATAAKNLSTDIVEDTAAVALTGTDSLDALANLGADSLTQDAGPLFTLLGPNVPRSNEERSAAIGFAEFTRIAQINAILEGEEAKKLLPKNARFAWSAKPFKGQDGKRYSTLYAINTKGRKESKLQGERVVSAFATPNQGGRGYAVSLDMDETGAQEWKRMTQNNIGRQVAVVLDDKVYSAPRVNEAIPNGSTSISGGFDELTEAQDLANILSIGKLPSKTEIIEEAIVGPSLGAATVTAGLTSLAIGFLLVLLFMLGYYSLAGFISVLALFLNIFFILGSLASFGTVLTLPGIAGIVLTIGMAVDANVIIFERIREELRRGLEWKEAILKGFSHSYSAIIDANITTLVVAVVLYQFGLGPIKGFAAVLIIGVACSVFSAVLVGRMLFDNWLQKDKEVKVGAAWSQNILANPGIDFVAKRKIAYGISGVVLVAGLASILLSGFELGVDLKGGRSYTVEFAETVNADLLKADVIAAFESVGEDKDNANKVIVREFSKATQAKITTSFMQSSETENVDEIIQAKIYEAAKKYSKGSTTYETFTTGEIVSDAQNAFYLTAASKVGPTIADDIRNSAGMAAGLSLLFIFLYILARFSRWQYSAGALAALVHDVLFVLSIFSIFKGILPFSLEIDQAFIAAILTVIGYSINDTVIVFDRIREVGREFQDSKSFKDIVNIAVNNTLSRTFITSLTTLLVVLILFIFGGDGIRGFAFALLMGVIVGTYSSIFIATPVVVDTTGNANIFDAVEVEPVEETGDDEIVTA